MQTTTFQPTWRRLVGVMGPVAQCLIAFLIVRAVSGDDAAPLIVPYLGVMLGFSLFDGLVRRNHPSVLVELARTDVPLADRLTFVGGGLLLSLHFLLAVADKGYFHWSGDVPYALQVAGLGGMCVGFLFATWAMLLNPYFSPIVRVQRERAHKVVTDGPYAVVRHPAYLGIGLGSIGSSLALCSYWSLVPVALFILVYARRAWFEDRKLRDELDGFVEYSRRVRFRLIPMVW